MSPSCGLLEYYTSKTIEFQVFLGEITIFVNYADFLCQHRYVNYSNQNILASPILCRFSYI